MNWEILIVVLLFILGWFSGGLVNQLSTIMPDELKRNPLLGTCTSCKTQQIGYSTLIIPRKCIHCGHVPVREWIVLLFYSLVFPLVYLFPVQGVNFFLVILILIFFGLVWVIDIEHRIVITSILLIGSLLCIVAGFLQSGWFNSLIGGFTAFVILVTIHVLGIIFVKIIRMFRKIDRGATAFALGDVALGTAIGFLLGFPDILRALFLTILIAGASSLLYLIVLLVRRQYEVGIAIPYAPFLICGALLIWFAVI